MKTNSPILLGSFIFMSNLGMQASQSATQVDIYRAISVAVLAGLFAFVVAPLFRTEEELIHKPLFPKTTRAFQKITS